MATTEPKKKYTCERCKKTMAETKFYTYKDGTKVELCKDCLAAHVNNFEPDTFLWILKKMDIPYIPAEWNSLRDRAYQQDPKKIGGPAVLGRYIAKSKLKQWIDKDTGKPFGWDDAEKAQLQVCGNAQVVTSEIDAEEEAARNKELKEMYEKGEIPEAEYRTLTSTEAQKDFDITNDFPGASTNPDVNFNDFDAQYISEDELPDPAADLTDEDKIYLAMKWGRLYKPNEWVALEKNYNEMMSSFDIQDADSINTLILQCKTNLKMNQALDCGDIDGYQKLSRVSDTLRKSAKFTAAQNKDKDNEHIDCVGVLVATCERLGGFIPNDLVDFKEDMIDKSIKDTRQYLYNLVTKDLGFGQQIENYLKKIQLEHDNMEKEVSDDEEDEITDENIIKHYERIEKEKELDSQIDEHSNAYERKEDDEWL